MWVSVTGQAVHSSAKSLYLPDDVYAGLRSKLLIPISIRSSFVISAAVNSITFWFLTGKRRHKKYLWMSCMRRIPIIHNLLEDSMLKMTNTTIQMAIAVTAVRHICCVWKIRDLQSSKKTKEKSRLIPGKNSFWPMVEQLLSANSKYLDSPG